ncbi:MAG: HAD-IA family hydrolase, partial [Parasphingopyxis sp.]
GMSRDLEKSAAIEAIMGRFDHVIESSKAGIRKPDPRIYAMMCEELEVDPQTCIYLDDLGINCKPAAAMGMRAIKVTSEAQALAELNEVLGRTS